MAIWRAWYAIEPRGEDRWDYLIAFLASLQISNDDVTLGEVLQSVRDMWTPMTDDERQRRKRDRKKRWKQRLKPMADAAKMLDQAKAKRNGSEQHRQMERAGHA